MKYVQFLTPMSDVITVLMHQFIITGHRQDGSEIYNSFISRRDPALDGPDGYDPLIDRFGCNPTNRCIALAVELEPKFKKEGGRSTIDSFDISYRQFTSANGDEKEVPNVGLIIQSPHIFFSQLAGLDELKPIEKFVWAIKRQGKGTDTSYVFTDVSPALDLGDSLNEFLDEFDFDAYLDDLASEGRMHELIDPLSDDFVVNKFANRGKGGGSKSAGRTATASTRARVQPQQETFTEDSVDEAPDAARARRFGSLREDLNR